MKNLLAIFLIDRLETERRLLSQKIDFFDIHEKMQQVIKSLFISDVLKINELHFSQLNKSIFDVLIQRLVAQFMKSFYKYL
jgi:hypothetical protein